jgi:DNA-directed RNA polymerase specialized sigma24 family protein
MWSPPWRSPVALGAFGLAPASDRVLADKVVAAVQSNIAAGRPFYDPVPPEFKAAFQQSARGIYRYLIYSAYMPKALGESDQKDLATKVVNKTYYNALRGMAGYRGEVKMKGWFYVIARNALIDELRMFMRTPEGAKGWRKYSFDAEGEVAQTNALRIQAEIAAESAEFELSPARFKDLVKLVRRASNVGHDLTGQPLISPEDSFFLNAYIVGRGDDQKTAVSLRMDPVTYDTMKTEVFDRVGDWVTRLRETLAARGETI